MTPSAPRTQREVHPRIQAQRGDWRDTVASVSKAAAVIVLLAILALAVAIVGVAI